LKNLSFIILAAGFYSCNGQAKTPETVASILVSPVVNRAAPIAVTELRHYQAEVTHFVDSVFTRHPFNGSILVAKNGEVIFEKYQGFRNPRIKKDSISSTTPFHLASCSKTFTAMAVLKLRQDGKIDINDQVSKYLPGFPLQGVTVKTLLNHRSGIPNYVHYMENLGWNRKKIISNQDVLDFIIARHKDIQIAPPDRRFSYSNTNFALLALIVEKVSGQAFPDFMRLTFFEPLGMHDTYIFTQADSARALGSFFSSGRPYPFEYLDKVYGDKNVYSTVRDMLKWDQALYGGTIFTRETLDAAFTGYSHEKPGINNYGLGWRMFNLKNGRRFIYHNGWWHGNRTAFYRLIDDKVTIIAFSNNDFTKVYSCKKMADIFGNYFKNPEEERASETENNLKDAATPGK
jgi:CubicO group peptidase (beta-lactamase class C family)